jgi:hypothetical protein
MRLLDLLESSKVLQRVLNALHVDFAPHAPSSSACILFNKHRGGRQEQKNTREGTHGAGKGHLRNFYLKATYIWQIAANGAR